jgi:Protein of unknown function (DUF1186)
MAEPELRRNGPNERIQRILAEFDHYDGKYRRDAVEEAVELKDEIIPYLIDDLRKLLADPDKYVQEGHWTCAYAFILLGHFREQKAYEVIVKIAALPEKILDELFGDMITEDFPWIFYATCGGSVELLKELILNRKADEYCRGAAAQALVWATLDGVIGREAAIDFLSSLFTGNEADANSDFWSSIASKIADLYPEEAMEVIRNAYEEGLIYDGYIDYGSFEMALKLGKERVLYLTTKEMERSVEVDNIHSRMSWWACFSERAPGEPRKITSYSHCATKKKDKARKKRKLTKASRRKNRR